MIKDAIKHLELSLEDRAVVEVLGNAGLLHPVRKEHFCGNETIPPKGSLIYFSCCDGRHYLRSAEVFRGMYDETDKLSFMPVPCPGGTLVFDNKSPLTSQWPYAERHSLSVIRSFIKKGYGAILAENHFPCEAMRDFKIPSLAGVESLMSTKKRFKEKEGIEITFVPLLKVTGDGKMKYYRIPYNDYLFWKERLGYGAIQQLVAKAMK